MEGSNFLLPASMTIGNIGDCHIKLLNSLEKITSIDIDCSELKQIDTAGVQLLIVFKQLSEDKNIATRWIGESQQLDNVLKQLGLQGYLY